MTHFRYYRKKNSK